MRKTLAGAMWALAVVAAVVPIGDAWQLARAQANGVRDIRPEVRTAERAMNLLQQNLQTRLLAALQEGGAVGAVRVCRAAAQEITDTVAREQNIELGRTSHRLRNPVNAPRAWIVPYLEKAAGKPASEVQGAVVDMGDKIGVLRPIATGGMCLVCHGDPRAFTPELRETLAELYPQDRAVGFREGEFRGFMWAEVKKAK
ncbi:MAG: DUF3365 domain-containing protein [Candidatus Binatia bacterium]|nr:DUF3365 domain-containing protein [Candidatus Binatia bacterium]